MSKSLSYAINSNDQAVNMMPRILETVIKGLQAGKVILTFGREKRSDAQNRKMWAMLRDISKQVVWGGQNWSDEDWKHIISASVEKQRIAPGVDGGFVVLGVSTRSKHKAWFADFFEQAYVFGTEQGVNWSEQAQEAYL